MNENLNQALCFGLRCQKKVKYLRPRLNRECNSKVNYLKKKKNQVSREKLFFIVIFILWVLYKKGCSLIKRETRMLCSQTQLEYDKYGFILDSHHIQNV